jgi:hypothetical protein
VEADLAYDGVVRLELGPTVAASLVHFVVAVPGELNGIAVTAMKQIFTARRWKTSSTAC